MRIPKTTRVELDFYVYIAAAHLETTLRCADPIAIIEIGISRNPKRRSASYYCFIASSCKEDTAHVCRHCSVCMCSCVCSRFASSSNIYFPWIADSFIGASYDLCERCRIVRSDWIARGLWETNARLKGIIAISL